MASKGLGHEQSRYIKLREHYSKKIVDKLTNEQKEELYQKIMSDEVDKYFGIKPKPPSLPPPKSNTTLLGIVMFFVGIFILYLIFK